MKIQKWLNKKALALLLAVTMAAPLMPVQVVSATENNGGIWDEEPQLRENEFDDLESLKEILSDETHEYVHLEYVGEDAFEITENLVIPDEVELHVRDKELIVAPDCTLRVRSLDCNKLNVQGTLEVKEHIYMRYPQELSGMDHISFRNDWSSVVIQVCFSDAEQLKDLLIEVEENGIVHERVDYSVWYEGENGDASEIDFVLDEDISVPEQARLELGGFRTVTIPENVEVTVVGGMHIGTNMTVNGSLVNHGEVSMFSHDGSMTLQSADAYSGRGVLFLHAENTPIDVAQNIRVAGDKFPYTVTFHRDPEGMYHYEILTDDALADRGEFINFEGLKKLVNSGEEREFYRYIGEEKLVITESLALPDDVYLDVYEADLTVNEDVTFEVCRMTCDELNVFGTLKGKEYVEARTSVTIDGKIEVEEGFHAGHRLNITDNGELVIGEHSANMEYPAVVSGIERISFREEWQKLQIHTYFENAGEVYELVDELKQDAIRHEKVEYVLQHDVRGEDAEEIDLVLNQDLELPEYIRLDTWGTKSVTVSEGATFTMNGEMNVNIPFKIYGTLKNNGNLHINGMDGGTIEFFENAAYVREEEEEGNGPGFQINGCGAYEDLDNYVIMNDWAEWFDIAHFHVDPEGYLHWELRYVKGLIKLGTPIDLSWGWRFEDVWTEDPATGEWNITGYTKTAVNGSMSWKPVRPDQAQAKIFVYRVGEIVPCLEGHWGFGEEEHPEYRSIFSFEESDLDSGTYYFTVQSVGDYKEYRNSDVAVSGTYTYVKPADRLPTCQNLRWMDRYDLFAGWAEWDRLTDKTYIDGYEIRFYFSETLNGEYEQFGGSTNRVNNGDIDGIEFPLEEWFLQEKGVGYYKFKVRAVSNDIEKMGNGEWSELSPALDIKSTVQKVEDDLSQLLTDIQNPAVPVTPADVPGIVQNMDTEEVKTTLLTDQNNDGATQMLSDLELLATGGVSTPVHVTQAAHAFNPSKVSVVGANLNNKNIQEEMITLEIDKPERNHVIEELYNSSVSVQFSMTLGNVEDPEFLQVPVKITLPVPKSINPDFLVIFHYHADGSYEIIEPHVYKKNGEYYADFVVTSFSDFVMTELIDDSQKPEDQKPSSGEEHVCVFDQEVATDVYLNTPATTANKATYFKSCVCTGKGTEIFEYGEVLKSAKKTSAQSSVIVKEETVEKEEETEEAVEETQEEIAEDVVEVVEEAEAEVEEDAMEEEESKGRVFPVVAIVLVAAAVIAVLAGVVLIASKKKA